MCDPDKHFKWVAIFEAKYSKLPQAMATDHEAALQQIQDKKYARDYRMAAQNFSCMALHFAKKDCLVQKFDSGKEKQAPFLPL